MTTLIKTLAEIEREERSPISKHQIQPLDVKKKEANTQDETLKDNMNRKRSTSSKIDNYLQLMLSLLLK